MNKSIKSFVICFVFIWSVFIGFTSTLQAATSLESIGITVTNLQFFESGLDVPSVDKRVFSNSFAKQSSRYIFYQLTLSHTELSSRVDLPLIIRFYKSDGSVFGEFTHNIYLLPEWKTSWHIDGLGWGEPDNWPIDTYTVKIFYGTEEITKGIFLITNVVNQPEIDGLNLPNTISLIDLTSKLGVGAPVYMGNIISSGGNVGTLSGKMELSVDFPAYNKPVDIWILIGLPDGRFYLADQSGNFLNLDTSGFLTIASGVAGTKTVKKILSPFEIPSANSSAVATPFDPFPANGAWTVYWLIAPASNGDIIKALENEKYELGFYIFNSI